MAVRLSGMVSGLDTDALVQELVSAYSTKKQTIEKAATKLTWTQDAWKNMNTKIYSFYSGSLSNMRFSNTYNKKSTSISNSAVAKVTASSAAVNGTQKLKVSQLATSGYLTGAKIAAEDGSKLTGSSKLTDLAGMENAAGSKIAVNANGQTKEIELTSDMTINQLVAKFKDAGVNASFDENNQRMFISAKTSGKEADFTITSAGGSGDVAIAALGLRTSDEYSSLATEYAKGSEKYNALVDSKYKAYISSQAAAEKSLYDGIKSAFDSINKQNAEISKAGEELTKLREELTQKTDEGAPEEEIEALNKKITEMSESIDKQSKAMTEATDKLIADYGDVVGYSEDGVETILDAANGYMADFEANYFTQVAATDEKGNPLVDEDGNQVMKSVYDASKLETTLSDYLDTDTELKNTLMDNITAEVDAWVGDLTSQAASGTLGASRIYGQDSEIYLNGAYFTSNSNTYEINGLTIQATAETGDEEVSITTDTDVDGIYNMIKDFFTQYNELVTSMDSAYNATSSKGYEPLTDDEKEAMTESQIEKWEEKIKDSLLRKDNTLGSISSTMKTIMSQSFTVNGKKVSLSTYGIGTLGYFTSGDNEKGKIHINGDADDTATSGNADKLRAAIATDPDSVISFFGSLATELYGKLTDKMASSSMSSAYTVYNDKQMTKQASTYKTEISDWEDKISDYEDRYYKKFAAMESAMASLNSQQSSLSGLLG